MMQRNTVQRTIVLNALRELANHPTAEDVYQSVHAAHPSVSKATVYRMLNRLAEEGFALRVPMTCGADRFDHRCDPHNHIRCTSCGRVDDVDITLPDSIELSAHERTGYDAITYNILLDGLCPQCQKQMAQEVSL